jgi:bifunctional non-homologous end joining protein LigD
MIASALAALPVRSATIDGEGVVCGSDGVSDFELLRAAVGRKGARNAFLYAFDLLELDGVDLRREPWDATDDIDKPVAQGGPRHSALRAHREH